MYGILEASRTRLTNLIDSDLYEPGLPVMIVENDIVFACGKSRTIPEALVHLNLRPWACATEMVVK